MNSRTAAFRGTFSLVLMGAAIFGCAAGGHAQDDGNERTFPQSKATIEKALKEMQTAGRLPVLDGFATSASHPLERYQRGYYQSKFQVSAVPSGGSIVRVSVQVTAWYADPIASKSGYQLLTSNGRVEADLLGQLGDQLGDQLAANAPAASPNPRAITSTKAASPPVSTEPTIAAPVPRLPEVRGNYSSSLAQSLEEQEKKGSQSGPTKLRIRTPDLCKQRPTAWRRFSRIRRIRRILLR